MTDEEIQAAFDSNFTDPILPLDELGRQVFDKQEPYHQGRGMKNLRVVAKALGEGNLDLARSALYNNWDKLEMYPDLKEWLTANGVGPVPFDYAKYFAEND